MKKIITNIFRLIILLGLLTCLDMYSIYHRNKPIFIFEEKEENTNKIYNSILYDVYYCADLEKPQIKLKKAKYNCPVNNIKEEINNKKQAKLTLVGDLLFEQPFYDAIDSGEDKNKYFNRVKEYFQNDDLSIGNMEVVIGNDNLETSGTGYNFCAPEYIGDLVNTLDFEVLSTANNHAYDRGIAGINSTIDFFENNTNIVTVGTYKNKSDREDLRILNINDIKFGILSYTYGTNQKASNEEVNLIGYYKDPYSKKITEEYKNILKEEIEKIKELSDVVIVLMHWGNEFTFTPNNEQKEMAKFLNELGVDIIVGSHSHNIQPIEVIGEDHKTLVYYSLGNFVSSDDDIARTKEGIETFDNAYQVGLLSTLNVIKENDNIYFQDINSELIVNYFDANIKKFELIPFNDYNEEYEKTHFRYNKGLTKKFIKDMYENNIDKEYRNK